MISVILCGGSGSRLWPLSREQHPKPFLRLPDGQNFLRQAFKYAAICPDVQEIITIANQELHFKVANEYKASGLEPAFSTILEPFGRNTAPAVAIAALDVKRRYGEQTPLLILAADHLISDQAAFTKAVAQALQLAQEHVLVVFGIKPLAPDTGFGYIQAEGSRVLSFVEKPDPVTARKYLEDGNYYWNSGLFCFQAGTILEELDHHAPALLRAVENCLKISRDRPDYFPKDHKLTLDADSFAPTPDISLDYAVMEKSDRAVVVPCDMGWSDIGSWTALCALNQADSNGNHVHCDGGEVILHDCRSCDIQSHDRLVATLGIDDLLIVDTPDAVLVAAKDKVQDVKEIYNHLKASGSDFYKQHQTVTRPWGSFTVLETGCRFKIKKLKITQGASISLQLHHHRSEHWIVVGGLAQVVCEDKIYWVHPDEYIHIKAGVKHKIINSGRIELIIIEVQVGDYLGEDDIVRFQDEYGRV